jgi:hypothetical protein
MLGSLLGAWIMSLLGEILKDLPTSSVDVREVRVGPYLTSVLLSGYRRVGSDLVGRCGLASSMAQHRAGEEHRVRRVGQLKELRTKELTGLLFSDKPVEAAIGMATLNAILDAPAYCFKGPSAFDLMVERGGGKRVAVVGHFPFVERLRQEAAEVHVLELRPDQGELPFSRAGEVLPRCDVIAITATTLMNGTHEQILPLCAGAFTIMLGPSTPPSRVLFAHGINALAGTAVVAPDDTLREISQGATYRDLSGVRKWIWIGGG